MEDDDDVSCNVGEILADVFLMTKSNNSEGINLSSNSNELLQTTDDREGFKTEEREKCGFSAKTKED